MLKTRQSGQLRYLRLLVLQHTSDRPTSGDASMLCNALENCETSLDGSSFRNMPVSYSFVFVELSAASPCFVRSRSLLALDGLPPQGTTRKGITSKTKTTDLDSISRHRSLLKVK